MDGLAPVRDLITAKSGLIISSLDREDCGSHATSPAGFYMLYVTILLNVSVLGEV